MPQDVGQKFAENCKYFVTELAARSDFRQFIETVPETSRGTRRSGNPHSTLRHKFGDTPVQGVTGVFSGHVQGLVFLDLPADWGPQ